MNSVFLWSLLAALTINAGCASMGNTYSENDPLEPINRVTYRFNDTVDRWFLKPVAKGYNQVVPSPARAGVTNFFANLETPMVMVNSLLQGKVTNSITDLSRFVFNSTLGLGGLIDIATPMGLTRHDEDFGQTLGAWGVGPGWYIVLPLLGPSTARDAIGRGVDRYMDPVAQHNEPRERNAFTGLRVVDTRARLLAASRVLEVGALDPYAFTRDAYLQRRNGLVYDGNPPEIDFFEDLP